MAFSFLGIDIDIPDTENKVRKLGEVSRNISTAGKQIGNVAGTTTSVWVGDCANEYKKKVSKMENRTYSRSRSISNISNGLSKSVNNLKAVESFGASLFGRK